MFNHSVLMGRIANDLELKTTQSGTEVLSFRIAVDRNYQADKNNRVSDFFNVVAWRNTATFINNYFGKGKMILVEGELQTRTYDDKNGVKHTVVELIADSAHFTGEKKDAGNNGEFVPPPANSAPPANYSAPPINANSVKVDVTQTDDDYPF